MARIASFREFWPYYVREHSQPLNRWLHFTGTSCAIIVCGLALATATPLLLPLTALAGYGFAWVGHFVVEKNRPATFDYPLWSLASDFVMYAKMWAGTMDREVERAHAAIADIN
jgi:hypothetical protein